MHPPSEQHEFHRQQLWHILHEGKGRTGQAFQFLVLVLILASVAMIPLEFMGPNPEIVFVLHVTEVTITALFTVEYALRIYAAPSRLRYIFSFFGILDLLSIAPFYIGLLDTQFLRTARLLRVIRLLRVGEIEAVGTEEGEGEIVERPLDLLHEGETVQHIIAHHPLYLLLHVLPAVVALGFTVTIAVAFPRSLTGISIAIALLLFTLVFLWRAWLNYAFDLIYVTSQRVIVVDQHLLGRNINQVNYHTITNVKPSYYGIFSYILKYGCLIIETSADQSGHFEFHMVRQHERAAQAIMQNCTIGQPP